MNIAFYLKRFAFAPLAWIWESVYRFRRTFYYLGILPSTKFGIPVISVGNLSFGGTGKTPMIAWLSQFVISKGLTPVILTRGYKGKYEHSSGIILSRQRFKDNPSDFGDEPLLLSRKLTKGAVIVGKNRAQNFIKYGEKLSTDVILLDDGHQHLQLQRNLNIVLFDATMSLDQYRVAPVGLLREGFSALDSADVVLVSKADQVPTEQISNLLNKLKPYVPQGAILGQFRYKPKGLYSASEDFVADLHQMKGLRALAVAAIASPSSFFSLLESLGVHLVDKMTFPDHHFFTHEEVNELLLKSAKQSAIIIASEKDIVKLKRVTQDPRLAYLSIEVEFLQGKDLIEKKIEQVLKL